MDNLLHAKDQILETLTWTPFDLCEDEMADAHRFAQVMQLAAAIPDADKAKDAIYSFIQDRIAEQAQRLALELDEKDEEAQRREAYDRQFFETYGGL